MSEKITVLYCEDEIDLRENGIDILGDIFPGSTVICCENGVEGQRELERGTEFDLILSDYNMPSSGGRSGDGKTLYEYYKKTKIKAPFVICSGRHEEEFKEYLEDEDFFYLEKVAFSFSSKKWFQEILEMHNEMKKKAVKGGSNG